ncbi:MAG TPA: alkaline phosphatase family protein [Candidatus Latescibacteria bacterium]|jgi:hypothetical protein|nr:hypothetical protein [Gemmatimonadaceae bacterium]MDP6018777.1 alkaline phosphatase family protein [Candidatus Latescibacterota bacterium]HJP31801.1 alkaline phosphatase family protein [Candidatus Latescibacterota bacterium]
MDLLLISIDSLRLDHAGRASNSRVLTPRFDRATEGFAFSERFFSVSSATRPVHSSLVTGLYPFEHGIQGQQDGRLRQGAPRLFRQCVDRGMEVGLFSEAAPIFAGLDLGAPLRPLEPEAGSGLAEVRRWREAAADAGHRCLFLHYWSAHTPYGASDGMALGETATLLREGRLEEVEGRYRIAVEDVFENKVAPLLERLDLSRCAVLLFGDHGESWTPDELYHGTTVRNSVLRVPLYLHVPYHGNLLTEGTGVTSIIDLYATICGLLGLRREDEGFGVDLLDPAAITASGYRLAEIRPGTDAADDERLLIVPATGTESSSLLRWCVFDDRHRLHGENEEWRLEAQWTEKAIDTDVATRAAPCLAAREGFISGSNWTQRPLEDDKMSTAEQDALRRRLQALGYL